MSLSRNTFPALTVAAAAVANYNVGSFQRVYIVIQNTGGAAGTYTLGAVLEGAVLANFTAAIAIAAGAFAFVTLPNDNVAIPMPLPDILRVTIGGSACRVVVVGDY